MPEVKFKDPTIRIDFRGNRENLTPENLTFEKYQKLIEDFPQYKELFIEVVETPKASKKTE